jgi:hypothetical protein
MKQGLEEQTATQFHETISNSPNLRGLHKSGMSQGLEEQTRHQIQGKIERATKTRDETGVGGKN